MTHLRQIATVSCYLISLSVMFGQAHQDSILTLQRIFLKPFIAGTRPIDPHVSPDGNLIMFRWDSTAQNKYRYWLMKSDGSSMRMIADTLISGAVWSPDSKTIACSRKGDVFLTDTAFQSFERVTKSEPLESDLHWSKDGRLLAFNSDGKLVVVRVGRNGVYDIAKSSGKDISMNFIDFTPDGKRVIFGESSSEGLPDFIVPRYTGKDVSTSSFKGGVDKARVGIAPVDTGATIWVKLSGGDRFFLGDIAVSPDGKKTFVERFTSDRKKRELFVADTDSGTATLIFEESDHAWVESGNCITKWMPDGRHIITTSEKSGWNHLYRMTPDRKSLTQLTDGDWEIRWFDVSQSGEKIFFEANKNDLHQWQLYSLDVATKSISKLTVQTGTYDNPTLSKDGTFIVASYSDINQPGEFVRIPTIPPTAIAVVSSSPHPAIDQTIQEVQLTRTVPNEFHRIHLVRPEIVHFKSRDGKLIPAMISKPTDFDASKKYPVVVFVHGAGYLQNVYRGWGWYYREGMFHTRLTQRGYIVLEVDYRGSAGYGREYRTDVYMHLGGKDLNDELDALEYLKSLNYIDPHRVGIYGGSYGGFLTLMGLFRSDAYACGAAMRAVTSWENYYKHNSWYTEARLGKPEDHADAYKISSPLTFADSLKKPLLLLHGMVDNNVFFQDAALLMKALQKAGKRFEVMMYPDESHSFTEPENWVDEFSRIEEFFDRYLLERKN